MCNSIDVTGSAGVLGKKRIENGNWTELERERKRERDEYTTTGEKETWTKVWGEETESHRQTFWGVNVADLMFKKC